MLILQQFGAEKEPPVKNRTYRVAFSTSAQNVEFHFYHQKQVLSLLHFILMTATA